MITAAAAALFTAFSRRAAGPRAGPGPGLSRRVTQAGHWPELGQEFKAGSLAVKNQGARLILFESDDLKISSYDASESLKRPWQLEGPFKLYMNEWKFTSGCSQKKFISGCS